MNKCVKNSCKEEQIKKKNHKFVPKKLMIFTINNNRMKNRILLQNKVNDAKNKSSRLCGKKLPLVMLLLILALGAKANPVETGRARQVATTFLNSNGSRSIGLTEVSSAAGLRW